MQLCHDVWNTRATQGAGLSLKRHPNDTLSYYGESTGARFTRLGPLGEIDVKESRKQAVSIRLGSGDIRKVKRLAERLGVRDSDIIRFALKWTLNRVAPLCDPEIKGPNLVPVFVETGAELIRHFELDAFRLETIINEGVERPRRVAHDDIALLALAGAQQPYALLHLRSGGAADSTLASIDALRQYLYDKYVYARTVDEEGGPERSVATEHRSSAATLVAG
jgi:hypothetical protein